MNSNNELKKQQLSLWIIWASMIGSLMIYFAVCRFVPLNIAEQMENVPIDLLKQILSAASVILIIAAFFIRKKIIGVSIGEEPQLMQQADDENKIKILKKYTSAVIVSLALCESIAIFGLVLYLIGESIETFYIFAAISFACMFFYRPRFSY